MADSSDARHLTPVSSYDAPGPSYSPEERLRRQSEAVSLRVAGLTYEQIGQRLGVSEIAAADIVSNALSRPNRAVVAQLREVENLRLDRAQSAIWTRVLEGDMKAISAFLRISSERSKLNGLYAPQKVDLTVGIRREMEEALNALEEIVLDPAYVVREVRDDAGDPAAPVFGQGAYDTGAAAGAADEPPGDGARRFQ